MVFYFIRNLETNMFLCENGETNNVKEAYQFFDKESAAQKVPFDNKFYEIVETVRR